MRVFAVSVVAGSVALGALGPWLGRRHGAAIRHEGIGRPYPVHRSALALVGDALVFLALIGLLIGGLLLFA